MCASSGVRWVASLSLVLLFALGLIVGCGGGGGQEGKKDKAAEETTQETVTKVAADRMYAGRVEGTDAFVGVAVRDDQNELIAYVCDGFGEALTIEAWFRDSIQGNQVDLIALDGERLQAQITPESVVGTFALAEGGTHAFEAEQVPVDGYAGVYWGPEPEEGSLQTRVGKIVLVSGEERGVSYPPYSKSRSISE